MKKECKFKIGDVVIRSDKDKSFYDLFLITSIRVFKDGERFYFSGKELLDENKISLYDKELINNLKSKED